MKLNINTIRGKLLMPNVTWWGWQQWYKWRWNCTHIDLGPISIYELREIWFWEIVAFMILPLRAMYHLFVLLSFHRNVDDINAGPRN